MPWGVTLAIVLSEPIEGLGSFLTELKKKGNKLVILRIGNKWDIRYPGIRSHRISTPHDLLRVVLRGIMNWRRRELIPLAAIIGMELSWLYVLLSIAGRISGWNLLHFFFIRFIFWHSVSGASSTVSNGGKAHPALEHSTLPCYDTTAAETRPLPKFRAYRPGLALRHTEALLLYR